MRYQPVAAMSLAALALASSCAGFAFIRMACSQLVIDRIDPLVEPGTVPSAHQHQFAGGNGLNATMDPSVPPADRSTCTTCQFTDDFSNYWTPTMYYQARNGSFIRLKQLPTSTVDEGANGGLTVYYFNNLNTNRISVFPQGFRMRHGDPLARGPEGRARFPDISYTCLDKPDIRTFANSPTFPTRPCQYGILALFFFPQCWDGKNLDSPDHASHLGYPDGPNIEYGGTCPNTHPVVVPQLVMEVRWDTSAFNTDELWGWRGEGKQPFLWSNGDREEWSLHADYIFGWKGGSLKNNFAVASCPTSNNCGNLTVVSTVEANKCSKAAVVHDGGDGWVEQLPGDAQPWTEGRI